MNKAHEQTAGKTSKQREILNISAEAPL